VPESSDSSRSTSGPDKAFKDFTWAERFKYLVGYLEARATMAEQAYLMLGGEGPFEAARALRSASDFAVAKEMEITL
jgi:hypothetical protein